MGRPQMRPPEIQCNRKPRQLRTKHVRIQKMSLKSTESIDGRLIGRDEGLCSHGASSIWLMHNVASFPGSRAGEEERARAWYTLYMHVPSSFGNSHTNPLHSITVNSVYLAAESSHCMVILPLRLIWYRFDGNCLHCFVRSNWWTSKEEMCQSRV